MDAVSLASRVRICDNVVFRDLDDETVLLHLGTGVYFGLDPVASRIWQLLVECRPLPEIVEQLVAEYEVSESVCARDLADFMAALRREELIAVDGGPTP